MSGEFETREGTAVALNFLAAAHPAGPWALTCITPDKKGIETKTFGPETIEACRTWLESWNGKRNIYWSVNPPKGEVSKKATREDIKAVHYLHVDVDPRVGEPLTEEHERLSKLFGQNLPRGVPPPSVVVFSGGGFQGFWKLEVPIPIDGDLARAEDAKRYNQRLELLFQADNCHNVDRIMRVPGTLNIPDAGKVAKGRLPAWARVIDCDMSRVYPLAAFQPIPKDERPRGQTRFGTEDRFRDKANPIGALSDLDQWNVPDRIRVIIAQGCDPGNPKAGDNSRSMWLFDAVCGLIRCDVPDAVILAIITDPAWPISASVLDKGSKADAYGRRQITQARDAVINPDLAKLNEQHFVIANDGGRCRVGEWTSTRQDGRLQLSFQSFDDFRNRYMHRKTQVGVDDEGKPILVPLGKFWLGHERRRQYAGIVFQPGEGDVINGHLNLWRGFAVEPRPGDWSLMQDHIDNVLASGDPVCADYIRRWAAWAVQNPAEQSEVALVFKGGQGTGKGTFARALAQLFGQHGMQVTAANQFAGRFNAHLRDVCLLFADEAVRPDDKQARGILKALLTEPQLTIEGKGKDVVTAPNCVKVVMASNEDWIVPADNDDRRFAVFEVSSHRKQDHPYFAALKAELSGGGLSAMLHHLQNMPLDDWHPRRDIPQTAARNEQKAASLRGFALVFLDLLRTGEIPITDLSMPLVATSRMQEYASLRSPRGCITLNEVADLFKKLGFKQSTSSRPRGFILPSLADARAQWDRTMSPVAWDDTGDWSPIQTPEGMAMNDHAPFGEFRPQPKGR